MYKRPVFNQIVQRIQQKRRFIQVLAGPRQTGKTTRARQVMKALTWPHHYASADEPALKDRSWLEAQWEVARHLHNKAAGKKGTLLVLDEIQKIPGWSESTKRLLDEDTADHREIHTIILGSSPLLVQRGLIESLAGRFEIIPITHWFFPEMSEAFGWDVDTYIFYGGYPGAADLISDNQRWANYIMNALIETTISRDILLMSRVDKPALLRRLFELGCLYSGQILSYQKMLGQLQDAGNTVTLAHYLQLLDGAGLITGIQKYAGQRVRQRASSPKLLALNTALISVFSGLTFEEAKEDSEFWGRLVESSVGATLANGIKGKNMELFYWRAGNHEVDFVLKKGKKLVAIEVKSTTKMGHLSGMEKFSREFPVWKKLFVGAGGIPVKEFLSVSPEYWFE